MEKLILPVPEIPKEIEDAINKNNLAVFIGAGVSRLLGCQDWNSLAKDLLKVCYEKKYINFNEYDTLGKDFDSKKLISIAYGILKDKNKTEFFKKLRESLTPKPSKVAKDNIYEKIYSMGTTFVTTNADKCFDNIFGKHSSNIIWDFKSVSVIPENHRLYHIHGSISDEKSLVFTTSQYLRQYQNDNYKRFLKSLFEKYVVLFIGYGLAEFELLDFLVLKSEDTERKLKPKHFALMPYFSYEKKIAEYYDIYFHDLNIQTIPFAKDTNGYEQLINVIDSWKRQIEDTTFLISNTIEDLKTILQDNSFTNDNIDKILQLVENSEIVFAEFISLCRKYKSATNYLIKALYKKGYFSPDKNKTPEESKENPGYFSVPSWNMMEFLEIYILYVNETGNKENFSLFKDIIFENIRNITKTRIDNFRTDDSLIEFIFLLDETEITEDCIDFLNYALHSKWDRLVISSVVQEKVLPRVIEFTDLNKIKKIISILFSFEYKEPYRAISLVDNYYLGKVFEKYFETLYKKLGEILVDIFEELISKLKTESLIFHHGSSRKQYPKVDSISYPQTLVNCYEWLVVQQEEPKKFLQQRKVGKPEILKSLIDIIIADIDSSAKTIISENEEEEEIDDYWSDIEPNIDEDIVLDSSQNVLDFIKKYSNNEMSNTSLLEVWARRLHNAVLQKPDMLLNDLDKFIDIQFVYIHQILSAYISLMRENKFSNNIKPVLFFIQKIIKRNDLWTNKKTERVFNYELWTIDDISEFVSQYCLNYSQSISSDEYNILKSFALNIYKHLNKEEKQTQGYVTYMLNSESGKCIESLIHLYFFSMSSLNKESDVDIKKLLLQDIQSKSYQSLFTAFGSYFAGFYYKDKEFAIAIYSDTLGTNDKDLKNAVLEGYLYSPYTSMTREYYKFLREKKFFDNIIDEINDNQSWCSLIARIASSAYIEGIEDLDKQESLLSKIIKNTSVLYIDSIVSYFLNLRKKTLSDEKISKIIKVWSEICEVLQPYQNNNDYNDCIVGLLQFLELIPYINDALMENIKFSIRWIPLYSIEHYIHDVLLKLWLYEENRKYIVEILELFSQKKVFFYDYDGKLTQIIRKIYDYNSAAAVKLCNIYVQNGQTKYLELLNEFKRNKGISLVNE